MNKKTFNKEVYFNKNGSLRFSEFQSNVKIFVDTVWQRSKEENAKGFQFFADLWRDKDLKHVGASEKKLASAKAAEPVEEEVKQDKKSKSEKKEK